MNNRQVQGQPANLQAQQILLQQLQQGQTNPSQFQGDSYDQQLYQYNRQQQPPQIQQRFFPQFQQQQPQQLGNGPLPYQSNSSYQSQQVPRQPPHLQQQFYNQQVSLQQQMQAPPPQKLNVDNPNTVHWLHQQQLAQLLRNASIPHFYARHYATNLRKTKNPYSEIKAVNLVEATKALLLAAEEEIASTTRDGNVTPTPLSALLHNKKHAQETDEETEQRMSQKSHGKQLWGQLDMSGQGLVNLSPKLFQYDFLESLYLNNNRLTMIPPIVSRLRGLRTLDLSHNRITEVPAQLGLCFNLRYLYLFDNFIKTLPYEFGNLYQLMFLGIEGNPMDLKIANLLSERGTKELIAYLKDTTPSDVKPQPRQWLLLEDDGEVIDPITSPDAYANEQTTNSQFTMMSYNTLCQHYATSKMYKFTPLWALNWEYRRNVLQQEILNFGTDIICMQEVETRTYQEFWAPLLSERGYKGLFFPKTRSKTMGDVESKKVDGCATFYKTSKFTLLQKQNFEYNSVCMGSEKYKKTKDLFNRFMNKDNIALITFLQHTATGEKIVLANTHLHWDPEFNDVKTLQVGILLEELQGLVKKFHHISSNEEMKQQLLLICGDFNSVKESAVYQLFLSGSVSKHEDFEGRDYGKFTDEGFRHNFKLKSAYSHIGELPFTNFSPGFTDVIDYLWYSTSSLQVKGLLGKVDEEYALHLIGIPDAHLPSDHIPLVTKFQIKRSGGNKPDFKPDFKSGPSRKT